jgi:hypothetical protein
MPGFWCHMEEAAVAPEAGLRIASLPDLSLASEASLDEGLHSITPFFRKFPVDRS